MPLRRWKSEKSQSATSKAHHFHNPTWRMVHQMQF
jgi:hypothetical protein